MIATDCRTIQTVLPAIANDLSVEEYLDFVSSARRVESIEDLPEAEKTLLSKYIESPQAHKGSQKNEDELPIAPKQSNSIEIHEDLREVALNSLENNDLGVLSLQQASLQNGVTQIEAEIVSSILNKVTKNAIGEDDELIDEKKREQHIKDLVLVLSAYYFVVVPLFGGSSMRKRAKEFNKLVPFELTPELKKKVDEIANKVAGSHFDTVLKDINNTIQNVYEDNIDKYFGKQGIDPRSLSDADLKLARAKAIEGATQREIVNAIENKFGDISRVRAKAIAKTETNRAFSMAQYEADLQFIENNELDKGLKYYKQWVTTNPEPCPTCLDLSKRPPIPFEKNFADLGETITSVYEKDGKTKVFKNLVNFEPLTYGNAHTNCGCRYELIIK